MRKPLERHFLNGQHVDCVSVQDSPDLFALRDRCATFLSQFRWYYHSHSWSYIHKIGNIWSCCYISQCLILLLPVMSSPLQLHEEYCVEFQIHIFSVSTNLPLSFICLLFLSFHCGIFTCHSLPSFGYLIVTTAAFHVLLISLSNHFVLLNVCIPTWLVASP